LRRWVDLGRAISDKSALICRPLLNRTSGSASITVQWTTLGLPAASATVRDLWSHTDLGTLANAYTATAIPSHGVVMLRVVSPP
jgi:hypothetical protein